MADDLDVEKDLNALTAELKRLEAEYNMYFGGRSPRPPHETRARVDALVKRLDRGYISGTGDKFRFDPAKLLAQRIETPREIKGYVLTDDFAPVDVYDSYGRTYKRKKK